MKKNIHDRFPLWVSGVALVLVLLGTHAYAQTDLETLAPMGQQELPNMGQYITPLAPQGSRFVPLNPGLAAYPDWLAGQAVTTVMSPDKKVLLVLTSGYNRIYRTSGPPDAYGTYFDWPNSNEYVFIYDISTPLPVKKQVVQIPNTYNGIVFDPSGWAFYVAGGVDDKIHIITRSATGTWAEQPGNFLALGHSEGLGLDVPPESGFAPVNDRVGVQPCAAGVAISADGKTLVVANYYNDSITVFYGGYGNWLKVKELDLRPGKSDPSKVGVPGGSFPFWVAVKGSGANATAYVSSLRDREIVVVSLGGTPAVTTRIPVKGQPNKMTLNAAQTLLYVVEDQSDTVDVIDTATNAIIKTIQVIAPAALLSSALAAYTGANPNSVTLSPDEKRLYVTNGNLNCVAVVALDGADSGGHVVGLIPTGWYPNSVSVKNFRTDGVDDGKSVYLFVVNGKSPTGANPGMRYSYGPPTHTNGSGSNEYNPQLIKAGLQSYPLPSQEQLPTLTAQVAVNNRFSYTTSADDAAVMAAVRQGIKHVIFIIKENRTYDQVLGDLEIGNGDPDLVEFGEAITPNQHNMARAFVTLDSFYATAEVSADGWPWTTSARAPDVVERFVPVMYAGRGLSLDCDGLNRNVNVAIPTLDGRRIANPFTPDDPDLLPGQTNTTASDGPDNEINTGYLWDSALRAGLTVRSYGFWVDGTRYNTADLAIPLDRDPHSTGTIVAYSTSTSLTPFTDPFFRGFDPAFPDYYRFKEWEREFDAFSANGHHKVWSLEMDADDDSEASRVFGGVRRRLGRPAPSASFPSLSLVRFMHNHTGDFATAIDGVNTPELQVADNDYAVGLLVQKVANSTHANDTLIFIVEDDAQDGGDHVDSHRTVALVAGAWVKQGALVSTQYNTIDFLRTIEEVLGLPPMNLNDALARPMADIFNKTPSTWSFKATPSAYLYGTQLPLPDKAAGLIVPKSTHDAQYWARVSKGMDFSVEDSFDFATYNRVLWTGLMGNKPYPARSTGKDLRQNRKELLARHRASLNMEAAQEVKTSKD